jgi:Ca2+-binding EF-hand superfamily protein
MKLDCISFVGMGVRFQASFEIFVVCHIGIDGFGTVCQLSVEDQRFLLRRKNDLEVIIDELRTLGMYLILVETVNFIIVCLTEPVLTRASIVSTEKNAQISSIGKSLLAPKHDKLMKKKLVLNTSAKKHQKLDNRQIQLQLIRDSFNSMDMDHDGKLSTKDLEEYHKQSGRWISIEFLNSWMKARDMNCDGFVGFDEFLFSVLPMIEMPVADAQSHENDVLRAFNLLRVQNSTEIIFPLCWEILRNCTKILNSEQFQNYLLHITSGDSPVFVRAAKQIPVESLIRLLGFKIFTSNDGVDMSVKSQQCDRNYIQCRLQELVTCMSILFIPQVGCPLGEKYRFVEILFRFILINFDNIFSC